MRQRHQIIRNSQHWLFSSQCVLRWCGIALTLVSSEPNTTSHSLTIIYSGSLGLGALMTYLPRSFLPACNLFISNAIITILQLVGLATHLIHFSTIPANDDGESNLDTATFARLWVYLLCLDASQYLFWAHLKFPWEICWVIAVLYLASGILFWSGICESQNLQFIFLVVATFMTVADLSFPCLSFLP